MSTLTHDELRELVPIYALDALGGHEQAEVRRHLERCRPCQEFLDAYLQATGNLALVAEPVAPPPDLRSRLMAAVAATPQAPRVLRPLQGPVEGDVEVHRAEPPGRGRTLRWERVTALVAVAALVAAGAFSVTLVQRLRQRDQVIATQHQFVQALAGSGVRSLPLIAASSNPNVSGEVYLAADGRHAGLVATGLGDPQAKVYKLWLVVDNQPVPVSTFRPDATGNAVVPIDADLSSMQGMAVTLESDPDVRTPQGPKVLQTA